MDIERLEIEHLELVPLALAPIIFIFTYVYLSDKYEREPLIYLVITFFLGVLIAYPVLKIEEFLVAESGISPAHDSNLELFIYAFFIIALTEEGMKFLVLRFYNYPHKEFDEPYDGIMYGVAVSLGFAAIENIMYLDRAADGDGIQIGILRMFTAVPSHAMFGVLMGFFVGKAKFLKEGQGAFRTCMFGLFSAVFFHGVYDFLLYQKSEFLTLFAFVALAVGIILAKVAMHTHVEDSPHRFKSPDSQDSPGDKT